MEMNTEISSAEIKKMEKSFIKKMPLIWDRSYVSIFTLFFLGCVIFAMFIWRQSMSDSAGWSQERKTQFLNSQQVGIVFKQNDFEQALKNIQSRQAAFNTDIQPMKDVFVKYDGYPTIDTE